VFLLITVGLYSAAVIVERLLEFSAARFQTRQCLPHIILAARHGSIEEAITIAEKYPKSHVVPVFAAIFRGFQSADSNKESLVRAQEGCRSAIRTQQLALTRRLQSLRTISVTVPILGLIAGCTRMTAGFRAAAYAEAASVLALSGYAAGCLEILAFSLGIAAVAIWMQRNLANKVRGLVVEIENSSESLLATLRRRGWRKQIKPAGSWIGDGSEQHRSAEGG
jgi:biopolymer transport protein ExbB/TolQ